ncbi:MULTISPECIES: aminopeptidase [unclassified Chryseobacterium]|uniref:aminopeptidase n=1 Tax=unclassified Chryseobacterium TaxID=2593645 RepID=UPI000AD25288|nr:MULTISPECIES: aminopeptidase [unclassified Chryseobacterium]
MKKFSIVIISFLGFVQISAQKDSIFISAQFSDDRKFLDIEQRIVYHNHSHKDLESLKLLNWISAYNNRKTALVYRKLEDRNNKLHFAKKEELGKLKEITITQDGQNFILEKKDTENLYLPLQNPLKSGESVVLNLKYKLQLPDKKFTGYGTSDTSTSLKYFFIVPDHFDSANNLSRNYLDIEETVNFNTFWKIDLSLPPEFYAQGNLNQTAGNSFEGYLDSDPEFIISKDKFPVLNISAESFKTEIKLGYNISEQEKQNLEFFLPLQMKFIEDRIGNIPERLFISEKFRAKEDFFGNNDISFWKFNFKLFTDAEKVDQDYFGIISKKVLDEKIIADKQNHHWFKNGLKSYLEIQYLKKFYRDAKLLGNITETKVLGIKPVKFFHASKVKLLDRYGLAYQYIMTQNLDQKIGEKFSELSNFNDMAISNFETGSLFSYTADKMGESQFNSLLKNYISENTDAQIDPEDFLKILEENEKSSAYFSDFLKQKNRDNFRLKNFKSKNDSIEVRIVKNTSEAIPVKLETQNRAGSTTSYWVETEKDERLKTFEIPAEDIYKITLNNGYIFPEPNYRDNYLYTKGIFSNSKKIKFKLIKDIPNPEFNEIYLNPRIRFSNAYDKFLLGMNFRNESLFDQKFAYSLTPYYSTGTGKMVGTGGVSYSILPAESFIRALTLGVSAAQFHYDYELAYSRASASAGISFQKNPRSTVSRGVAISYNYYQRDLSAKMIANLDYSKYNLWSVGYGYTDNQMIHEKSVSISTQGMEDYNKITAEAFYRWEFAPKQKLSLRLFAGYFARNKTRNNTFNYGISRVSDYSFSYNLLGQSATEGLLSQQYVLADGGFKSFIPGSVNQWITSFNLDTSVWKMIHVYADAGVYKNKNFDPKFIWDSGLKVRVIPDFLEVYLPVQSSLGFEPGFKDYGKRIRYTLILNLGTIINAARRGWY